MGPILHRSLERGYSTSLRSGVFGGTQLPLASEVGLRSGLLTFGTNHWFVLPSLLRPFRGSHISDALTCWKLGRESCVLIYEITLSLTVCCQNNMVVFHVLLTTFGTTDNKCVSLLNGHKINTRTSITLTLKDECFRLFLFTHRPFEVALTWLKNVFQSQIIHGFYMFGKC